MEDPGAGARGLEDHHLAVSAEGGVSVAAAPEPGGGSLAGAEDVCGAREAGLFTSEEEGKGRPFAVGLVDPVEAVSASHEGPRIEAECSRSQERPMVTEEEILVGSLPFAPQDSAEPGSLRTCHMVNGGASDEALCVPGGEAGCSKDVGCVYGALDKVAEGSQCGLEDSAGNGGVWCRVAEVTTSIEHLQMTLEETDRVNEGSLDLMKHRSEQSPRGCDGVGSIMDANNEQLQNGLVPNIEPEVCRPVHEGSVPSVSGSIDVLLDRKAVLFGKSPGDSLTSHLADGSLWNNKGLCVPVAKGSQSIDAGCLHDTVDMATEGNSCEQNSLGGDEGVLNGGVDVKTNLVASEMHCNEPHSDKKGFPDSVKPGVDWSPYGMAAMCLKEITKPDCKKYGLLPKVGAEGSLTMHEDSVPSVSGRSVAVSLDGKHIGKLSEHRARMGNVIFGSLGGDTLSCESVFHKEAPGDESQSTTEKYLQIGCIEAAHDKGDLSGLGGHHTEKLQCGADSLTLITGANHEMEKTVLLPNIDAAGSCPVDEDVISSMYGSSIDVSLDGRAGQMGYVSERSSNVEKLACNTLGRNMLSFESDPRSEAFGDENQESSTVVSNRLNLSVSKTSMEELKSCGPCAVKEMQQISKKYGISELSPERDLHSSYNLKCEDEPCCNERDSSALSLGHQDSGLVGSGSLDHLEQGLNAGNFADDKAGSADFVSIGNDRESQSQKLSTLFVFRRRNPKRAASSRNLHSEKADQINKASSGSRRPKKVELASSLHPASTFPNKVTRVRSGMNKTQKSSAWGSLNKLMDGFSQTNKCASKNIQIADTDATSDGRGEDIPVLASRTSECTDGNNMQQLKRGLVSSTQEICAANIHGECVKLSSSEPPLKDDNGIVMLPVGFSPDSVLEVASVMCESNASGIHDVLHEISPDTGGHRPSVLPTSYHGKDQASSLMHLEQRAKTAWESEKMKRERTNPSHAMIGNDVYVGEGKVQTLQKSNTVKKNNIVRKPGCKKKDGTKEKNLKCRTQISSCEASKLRALSDDSVSPDSSELLVHTGHPEQGSSFEVQTSATKDLGNILSNSVTDSDKGSSFHTTKSPRRKRKDANAGKKGKVQDPHTKGKGKKKNMADGTSLDRGNLPSTELPASHMSKQSDLGSATEVSFKNSGSISTDVPGNVVCKMNDTSVPAAPPPPPRAAWVCCDDCQKWRCIPAELADIIGETNCRWTCKDNGDKAFADCSIPQEKTNAEINAELELSDVSADEADGDGSNSKASRAPSWTHVRLNLFLHRNRRTQSIDESMVCNCKPPQDGQGCGDGCLNRMLNIECVKRTCPCGEQCSNQQFQRRNYAKLRWFHSGKKGYGLQLQEDVSEGRFLIEYVGEVLDIVSYESRQRYYASKGQKHFYFMALNGGEVIDACTKGNLGRFINHSCSPNCRTEKWMVNGEVCIGIFAMRNIKKGEELTFDYNYVRVSGAAPQKCFCGTAKCRGYLGGDISVVDTITKDDAEAGPFTQVIAVKDSEELRGANKSILYGGHPDFADPGFSTQGEDLQDCCPAANADLEPLQETGATLSDTSEPENDLEAWSSQPQEDEDVIRTPVHVSRTIESSLQHIPVHGTRSLQKAPNTTKGSKASTVINGSEPIYDSRDDLVPGFSSNKRRNLKQHKNVKSSSQIENEHILGVEGRLNNLLDKDGGISKRKDATNGYLKLLFVTAAEGDHAGGTSKSVRDLSLILDALLKTKSRSVLLDIINKNGLQMLHNILRQNRSNFHRIPILRKLLKVLEFLALKEILTFEHINGGPRCAGGESFRDSMLSLTRHNDIQVHQIARNFRDRWIPRNITRSEPTEYPHAPDFQGTNLWNSSRRKRKSRWDYQPDEHYKMVGLKFHKAGSEQNADDDVPPGFESQQEHRPVQVSLDCVVAPGLCMGRYQPSLPISYGIPVALAQQFGTPEAEGQCHKKWNIAPGVPFNPFPPLPPYPRGSPCPSTSPSQISQHDGTPEVKHNSSGHCGRMMDRDGRVHRTWRNGPRTRWPYNNHGRKFTNNHHRFQPSRPQ